MILGLDLCSEFNDNFNGKIWGHNGPSLLTRVFRKYCNVSRTVSNFPWTCNNGAIRLLPQAKCYPIFHDRVKMFYEPSNILKFIKDAYFVHVWDKYAIANKRIATNSTIGYIHLAEKFCPRVLAVSGQWF